MVTQTLTKTNKKVESVTREEHKQINKMLFDIVVNHIGTMADLACPRCGGQLTYTEIGSSFDVICETDDCINYSGRGI